MIGGNAQTKPIPKWVRKEFSIKVAQPKLMVIQYLHTTGSKNKNKCLSKTLQMAVDWHYKETKPPKASFFH